VSAGQSGAIDTAGGAAASAKGTAAGPGATGLSPSSLGQPARAPLLAPSAAVKSGSSGNSGGSGDIKVGIEYVDLGTAGTTLGNTRTFDFQAPYRALIEDVNAHGGLLGHRIVPVWAAFSLSGNDPATQEQSICAAWTQDNHIQVALISVFTGLLLTCLDHAGVPMIAASSSTAPTDGTFSGYRFFAEAGGVSLNRWASVYVDGLWDQGYFDKGAKVGLVSVDTPWAPGIDKAIEAALARHGLSLTSHVSVPPVYTISDAAAQQPSDNNAVLRFRTAGVTHVLFNSSVPEWFLNAADAQRYRPRYGFTTNDSPYVLVEQPGGPPQEQLQNSVGVGWNAPLDGIQAPLSPSGQQCLDLMKAKGVTSGTPSPLVMCDQVSLLVKAATAGGTSIDGASLMSGIDRLGQFTPASGFRDSYGPGRLRDGAAEAAHFAYDTPCSCFRYTSAAYAI
jgi:hypothetical protein